MTRKNIMQAKEQALSNLTSLWEPVIIREYAAQMEFSKVYGRESSFAIECQSEYSTNITIQCSLNRNSSFSSSGASQEYKYCMCNFRN